MSAKKKVFVSIPMKGRTDEEIKREMKMVFDQMYNSEEYELIDTVHHVEGGRVATFAESIRKLATADVCCFAPGWEAMLSWHWSASLRSAAERGWDSKA